ncbi:UNVERIFIED_CONTAM: hypothetical protein GTU68_053757 [Idotea baltica]|nr:hypothetical protein [Idotea baltica]
MLRSGAFILIDKPFDWTSFDVVNKLRIGIKIALGEKKYKLGHAGTLDPYATGLLVLGGGSYTKKIEQVQNDEKYYQGTLELGATTASYDAELEIDQRFPYEHITREHLDEGVLSFKGHIDQVPPLYSAIKINGQAAYKMARKGVDITMKPRKVDIYDFDITEFSSPMVKFDVRCGKGTYIRSLVHDLGKHVGSGAYLTQLRRTAIGQLSIDDAWTIENFVKRIDLEKQKLNQ